LKEPCLLIKTPLGMEKIVASRIKDIIPYLRLQQSPKGYQGLVLVYGCRNPESDANSISDNIIEAEKVLVIYNQAKADPDSISKAVLEALSDWSLRGKCFAVRTVRRGKHSFTSIDVNRIVGSNVQKATGACVNLTDPDIVIGIEIIDENAYITIYPGSQILRKYQDKKMMYNYTRKISVIQMPYLAEPEVSYKMGLRVGREVQNFEVKEIIIAPIGLTEGLPLAKFIEGVNEGIESRYRIQKKSYSRKPQRTIVRLQDLYQVIRSRRNEPIIVLEPEGNFVTHEKEFLVKTFVHNKRVNILAGSREGIPIGVYRVADKIIDIAPGITLSTEFAVVSGLIAIITTLYDWVEDIE
jgi:tRNA acetyltransferase TAN1